MFSIQVGGFKSEVQHSLDLMDEGWVLQAVNQQLSVDRLWREYTQPCARALVDLVSYVVKIVALSFRC